MLQIFGLLGVSLLFFIASPIQYRVSAQSPLQLQMNSQSLCAAISEDTNYIANLNKDMKLSIYRRNSETQLFEFLQTLPEELSPSNYCFLKMDSSASHLIANTIGSKINFYKYDGQKFHLQQQLGIPNRYYLVSNQNLTELIYSQYRSTDPPIYSKNSDGKFVTSSSMNSISMIQNIRGTPNLQYLLSQEFTVSHTGPRSVTYTYDSKIYEKTDGQYSNIIIIPSQVTDTRDARIFKKIGSSEFYLTHQNKIMHSFSNVSDHQTYDVGCKLTHTFQSEDEKLLWGCYDAETGVLTLKAIYQNNFTEIAEQKLLKADYGFVDQPNLLFSRNGDRMIVISQKQIIQLKNQVTIIPEVNPPVNPPENTQNTQQDPESPRNTQQDSESPSNIQQDPKNSTQSQLSQSLIILLGIQIALSSVGLLSLIIMKLRRKKAQEEKYKIQKVDKTLQNIKETTI